MLQVSNVGQCSRVGGIIVALCSLKATQSPKHTTKPRHTVLLSICSQISYLHLLSPSALPLFSATDLCLSQSVASFDPIWHLVVKHRLHPVMFPLLLWLSLTLASASQGAHTSVFSAVMPQVWPAEAQLWATVATMKIQSEHQMHFFFFYLEQKHKTLTYEVKLSVLVSTLMCELPNNLLAWAKVFQHCFEKEKLVILYWYVVMKKILLRNVRNVTAYFLLSHTIYIICML